MKRSSCVAPLLILAFSGGSTNATAQELQDVANMPRPIEALDNVWIEELTMMEVRDALAEGKTTALILTGGIEENGPYLTTGKHNHVLRVMGESIARRLGDALIAPIVALEPGNPANSRSPGTVVLSRGTYEAMLTDMATSLRSQGFQNIILIGDSGGNQRSMATVADALSTAWRGDSGGIYHIPEYYNYDDVVDYQRDVLGVDAHRLDTRRRLALSLGYIHTERENSRYDGNNRGSSPRTIYLNGLHCASSLLRLDVLVS